MLQPILSFLADLKKNNRREWFETERPRFDEARQEFVELVETLIEGIGKFDPDIKPLEAKDCIFRQYRDVRFSSDKTPYKQHIGAYMNQGGKKVNTAGYYLHIEPGKSLIAGGLYQPGASHLKNVRQEIDYNFSEWESLLQKRSFKKAFPSGISTEDSLKRPPRGYDLDNPALKYMKLKSFVFQKALPDAELMTMKDPRALIKIFAELSPVINFLNLADPL